jgi:predicted HAD superfamily Cof-like phosphohydrolase
MNKYLQLVKEFHDAFGVKTPNSHELPEYEKDVSDVMFDFSNMMNSLSCKLHFSAKIYDKDICLLRLQLIQEELSELALALSQKRIVNVLDALADLQYVISGTVLAFGLQNKFDAAFQEVHLSNMSKLENGQPLIDAAGRVKKGKDYFKPNLEKFFHDKD